MQPHKPESELAQQDDRCREVALQAIERVKFVLDDKQHFTRISRESAKEERDAARQLKEDAYAALVGHCVDGGHVWTAKGAGLQCKGCRCRANMYVSHEQLLRFRSEACSCGVPVSKGVRKKLPSAKLPSAKLTRFSRCLLAPIRTMGGRVLELKKNYLVCAGCGQMILRRSSVDKLSIFIRNRCWNEARQPPPQWQGHLTHDLWRKGSKVTFLKCGSQALSGENGFATSAKLKKQCARRGTQMELPAVFKWKEAVEVDF